MGMSGLLICSYIWVQELRMYISGKPQVHMYNWIPQSNPTSLSYLNALLQKLNPTSQKFMLYYINKQGVWAFSGITLGMSDAN